MYFICEYIIQLHGIFSGTFCHRDTISVQMCIRDRDNDARAIFYARGVLETVKKLRWCPDIIHCHGWMTGLAPLYIKKVYKDRFLAMYTLAM